MLPFFQAFENFTNGAPVRFGPYYKRITSVVGEYMNNYMLDENYNKLFDWYIDIQMPNGFTPTIDDTWNDNHKMAILALTGREKHKSIYNITQNLIESDYAPDFLIHVKELPQKIELPELVNNRNSGNLVWRQNADSMHKRHYLLFNVEDGTALNGGNPKKIIAPTVKFKDFPNIISGYKVITWGHEHADLGNFIICGGEDQLIIDPPYFGDKIHDNFDVNQAHHHNIVLADGEGPEPDEGPVYSYARKVDNDYFILDANYSYWNKLFGVKTDPKASLNREIEITTDGKYPVYVINDWVKNKEILESFPVQFNLNGNGLEAEGTFSLLKNNVAVWTHPCTKDSFLLDNYQVVATFSSFFQGQTASNFLSTATNSHGNKSITYNPDNVWVPGANNYLKPGYGNICKAQNSNSGQIYGDHTTIFKEFSLAPGHFVNFKTTIEVLPCNVNPSGGLVRNNGKYNLHTIFPSQEITNFHVSRTIYLGELDTIINPRFNGDTNEVISTDALSALFSFSNEYVAKFGNCISETNFRKCRIRHGKKLVYKDTTLIDLSTVGEVFYRLIGKNRYHVYVQLDSASELKLFLPDIDIGNTVFLDSFSFTFNDTTKIVSIDLPGGYHEFYISPGDPCLFSCYFPPTEQRIDSTFNFNDGTHQNLSHKLDIVQPAGLLEISNNSKMEISCHKYLRNKDSLLILGACGADVEFNFCELPSGQFKSSPLPGIIVSAHSSLVLDSGSFTRIGNNSAIVLKSGSSLIVKDSAVLQIGDGVCGGFGFIAAEPGSNVYIQPGAKISFYKTPGDTVDSHNFILPCFLNINEHLRV